jgi:hypothetical protein
MASWLRRARPSEYWAWDSRRYFAEARERGFRLREAKRYVWKSNEMLRVGR